MTGNITKTNLNQLIANPWAKNGKLSSKVAFNLDLKSDKLSVIPTASNFPAKVFQLPNGLTVIHQYLKATPVSVVDVWVKAGAAKEPDPWSGMAHFLEHMIFKGTDNLPPGAFDWTIENLGGMTNAATSHDYAHFFIMTATEYLEASLLPLADLLLNPSLPEDEFIRERDVVLEEIRQEADNPDWLAFQALMETVYQHHPYGRSVLGDMTRLMERSPLEMRQFHHTHYQPENMTVTIVGGIEEDEALELVGKAFENFPTNCHCPQATKPLEPPNREIRRRQMFLPRLEGGRLMMAWVGPGVEKMRDAYGLDLLAVTLAEGRTSRLVRELREERHLVQGITSNFSLQQDSSLFTIGAWLEPENISEVEAIICDRLFDLHSSPISDQELARGQRLLCNDYAFSTETASQIAGLYGYYQTIANAEVAVSYPQQIQSFQPEALQELASMYLSPDAYSVAEIQPYS
jgi:zinc protease